MFAFKKKYFLIIENIKDINLRNKKIKQNQSLFIEVKKIENINELLNLEKFVKKKE